MRKNLYIITHLLALLASLAVVPLAADESNLVKGAKSTASSALPTNKPEFVSDGQVTDESRWLAAKNDKAPRIEFTFPSPSTSVSSRCFPAGKTNPASKTSTSPSRSVENKLPPRKAKFAETSTTSAAPKPASANALPRL